MKNDQMELIFEQVTEDVSAFLWAVRAWPNDGGEHAPAYILLKLLYAKGRAERAMKRLGQFSEEDFGADIQAARKLKKIHAIATEEWDALMRGHRAEIARLVNLEAGLFERLQLTENRLQSVRRIVQDGVMDGNEEWLRDDYKAAVISFLNDFSEFSWWFEAAPEWLTRTEGFGRLQSRYVLMEMAFRKWFSCFHQAEEILARFRAREYDADFWWLRETPEPYDIAKDCLVTEDMLPEIGRRLTRLKGTVEVCPKEEILEDFALGREVPGKDEIEAHIAKCRWCQGAVAACRESEAIRKGEKPIPPRLAALIEKYSSKKSSPGLPSAAALEKNLREIEPEILVPQSSSADLPPARKKGKLLSLETFRKKGPLKTEKDLVEALQDLEPAPESLPLAADSRQALGAWRLFSPFPRGESSAPESDLCPPANAPIYWGKRIELIAGLIQSITFFPVLVEKCLSVETHVLFSGALKLDPPPQGQKWFCDWQAEEGAILEPMDFEVLGHRFRAAFGKPFPVQGKLRLLLIVGNMQNF